MASKDRRTHAERRGGGSRRPGRPALAPVRRPRIEHPPADPEGVIAGRHPVLEALRRGRALNRLWVRQGMSEGSLREIVGLAQAARVPVAYVPAERLDMLSGGVAHQGVVAGLSVTAFLDLSALEALVRPLSNDVLFLLDQIMDPQNLGAIVRVADAIGASGVIVPERGGAGLTPAVAKASAGAVEHIPIARAVNMAGAVETVKSWGYFVYAAVADAEQWYTDIRWEGKVALVIGSEGQGVRPLVKAKCDECVKIPMMGRVESLNAAAATAVIGYEILRQRGSKTPQNP